MLDQFLLTFLDRSFKNVFQFHFTRVHTFISSGVCLAALFFFLFSISLGDLSSLSLSLSLCMCHLMLMLWGFKCLDLFSTVFEFIFCLQVNRWIFNHLLNHPKFQGHLLIIILHFPPFLLPTPHDFSFWPEFYVRVGGQTLCAFKFCVCLANWQRRNLKSWFFSTRSKF